MATKMFPLLFGHHAPGIIVDLMNNGQVTMVVGLPWAMMTEHEKQAIKNHGQTIQRLAERGGLSASEACAVLDDRPYHQMQVFEAHARLKELFSAYITRLKIDTGVLV